MRSRPTPSPSGWRYSKKTRGTSALVSSDLNSQQTVQVPLPWLGCCNTGANRLGNRSVCRNTAPDKPRWKPFPGFPGVPQMTATSTSRFHKKNQKQLNSLTVPSGWALPWGAGYCCNETLAFAFFYVRCALELETVTRTGSEALTPNSCRCLSGTA